MPSPVGQEVVYDFTAGIHVFPSCGPADDAEFVVVAFADGIGAVLDEETNDGEELFSAAKWSG